MNSTTAEKRAQFQQFVQQVLAPDSAVKGVVGIGSIATGTMHPASDVDAAIFLDPFDYFVIPAEAIWDPNTDTFHSIFSDDAALKAHGLELDFLRLDWHKWTAPDFTWPEGYRAEVSAGWLVYDRDGDVARLIAQKTAYPDDVRLARLDEAVVSLDQHLSPGQPQRVWQTVGPAVAHDRLAAAYSWLVGALFAYNRRWRIWRNREMEALLQLPWLPPDFAERVLVAANAPELGFAGYMARADMLQSLFADLLAQLIASGDYSHAPVDQAFMRMHDEPGRSWNMLEWNKLRLVRRLTITGAEEAFLGQAG